MSTNDDSPTWMSTERRACAIFLICNLVIIICIILVYSPPSIIITIKHTHTFHQKQHNISHTNQADNHSLPHLNRQYITQYPINVSFTNISLYKRFINPPLNDKGPDLIIIGSTNGGTSTINELLNDLHEFHTHLEWNRIAAKVPWKHLQGKLPNIGKQSTTKSQYTKTKQDLMYWNDCKFINENRILSTKKFRHASHKLIPCNKQQYFRMLGIKPNNDDHLYHWERTSDYNRHSDAMEILAHFKQTKFILTVRESFSQILSRIKNFICISNKYTFQCVGDFFQGVMKVVWSSKNKQLRGLLEKKQTENVRKQIIDLFNNKKILSHETMDICPYVNIIVFLDELKKNGVNASTFKIMQFEDMVSDLKRMSINIYCFVKYNKLYFAECVQDMMRLNDKYFENIMDNSNEWLHAKDKGKKRNYVWKLNNMEWFEQMNRFHTLCDARLMELLNEYNDANSSIVLGNFNVSKWQEIRNSIKQSIEANIEG